MKIELAYYWGMFSLYINLKRFFIDGAVMCAVLFAIAVAFRDYWMLLLIPFWLLLSVLFLYLKWRRTIKPDREMILKQIELEESYPFFYERFTKTNKEG